ncbi:MAG: hypothetical protein HQ594_01050 [Candidatus Omnitrophica bacterium]|nr:hypothetical protein [Candidatus Omnitrophota bacterium]
MVIKNNINLINKIEKLLKDILPIKLGVNKKNEIIRLIYEISQAHSISPGDVLKKIDLSSFIEDGKGELFHKIKNALLEVRYPSFGLSGDPHIMPVKLDHKHSECPAWDFEIHPKRIFIEKDIKDLDWTKGFLDNFSDVDNIEIDNINKWREFIPSRGGVERYNARRENIFLVKSKAAFIKACPCTKKCVRCGYWILNIGFGCPIDCSYCYLQTYSNAPGLVLNANIDDYLTQIEGYDKKAKKKVRIGTGEFTDSLALDRYTKYSSYLIPHFKNTKNLVLELKTKIADIDNVLSEEAHDNVVISWSMNTRRMAELYEKGGAGITERIEAARKAAGKGYKIGFHFDPIIYYNGWEKDYKAIVEEMFSWDEIRKNTVWISLGSLRYTPGLKQAAEERFSDNLVYYKGEFFMDIDGKLRYPRALRTEMYNNMIEWIRSFTGSAWIYLCMEPEDLWTETVLTAKEYK